MATGRSHSEVVAISFAVIEIETAGEHTYDLLEECKTFRLSLPQGIYNQVPDSLSLLHTRLRNLCTPWTEDECSRCGHLLTTKYKLLEYQKSCRDGTDFGDPPTANGVTFAL